MGEDTNLCPNPHTAVMQRSQRKVGYMYLHAARKMAVPNKRSRLKEMHLTHLTTGLMPPYGVPKYRTRRKGISLRIIVLCSG